MARTSLYGDILQASVPKVALPSWVTNAGYGDLTKELAAADIAREQADQQRLDTIIKQNAIDKAAEQQAYQDALAGRYKDAQPRNIREAYQMGAEEALSRGRSADFLSMRDKLDELDKQEKLLKRQNIGDAINMAKVNPDYAQKMLDDAGLPGSEIFSEDAKRMLRTKGTGRNAMYYDPETDSWIPTVPRSGKTKEPKFDYIYNYYTGEAMKIEKGSEGEYGPDWVTKKPTPDELAERQEARERKQKNAKRKEEQARKASEPWAITEFLRNMAGTSESRAPVATPSPTPTPAVDRPRGDSQRGQPTVNDMVATMKRTRSVRAE